jgi:hypothetical protein
LAEEDLDFLVRLCTSKAVDPEFTTNLEQPLQEKTFVPNEDQPLLNLQRLMESLINIVKVKTKTLVNTWVYQDDVLMTAEKDQYDSLIFFDKELRTFLARAGVMVN